MKAVDGIDLGALATETEAELLRQKRLSLIGQISGIYTNIQQWSREQANKAQELAKLDEKIGKATTKLSQVKSGDWNALEDEKPQQTQATAQTGETK